MEYLNITFPTKLKEQLDREVIKEKTRRSTLIQKAVRVYLGLKSRKDRVVDKIRLESKIGHLSEMLMGKIEVALRISLDLK